MLECFNHRFILCLLAFFSSVCVWAAFEEVHIYIYMYIYSTIGVYIIEIFRLFL